MESVPVSSQGKETKHKTFEFEKRKNINKVDHVVSLIVFFARKSFFLVKDLTDEVLAS